MKIYMIRHGESMANKNKFYSGWGQFPLSEQGIKDAVRAGQYLRNISFDKIYCSDLLRARQTHETALPGTIAEEIALVREINVGELCERYWTECAEAYGEMLKKHTRAWDFTPFGGENYEQLHARVREFQQMIEKVPYETIAVFCHEGVVRTMLDLVTGVHQDRFTMACQNGSVSIFEYYENKWKLLTWNLIP